MEVSLERNQQQEGEQSDTAKQDWSNSNSQGFRTALYSKQGGKVSDEDEDKLLDIL